MHALAVALAFSTAPSITLKLVPTLTRSEPRFEITTTPIVDLYFYARWLSSTADAKVPEVTGLKGAVEAADAMQKELGSPFAFGPLEGLLAGCATAKDVRGAFGRASETIELRSGKTVELRKGAGRLADALTAAEPAFLEKLWPAHQTEIRRAQDEITAVFQPKQAECLRYVIEHLALTAPELPLRVVLVHDEPAPAAVTQRDDDDRGISFVAVHGVQGTQLFETILHEATHTLDLGTKSGSVLAEMRTRLEKAGFTRQDREWRDAPHTLMFIQAGETIRRIVDPKHEHYGVVAGYYAKVQAVADIERPIWISYLDGKIGRDEAVEKIVAALAAAKSPR